MLKSITLIAAVMLAVTVLIPRPGAAADSTRMFIMAVDYDVAPGQVDAFIAAAKENAIASVKEEPGCRELNFTVSQKDPNHVFFFEVYDNAAALEAHVGSAHFKKYKAITKDMVVKREARPLWSVSMNMKGM